MEDKRHSALLTFRGKIAKVCGKVGRRPVPGFRTTFSLSAVSSLPCVRRILGAKLSLFRELCNCHSGCFIPAGKPFGGSLREILFSGKMECVGSKGVRVRPLNGKRFGGGVHFLKRGGELKRVCLAHGYFFRPSDVRDPTGAS